MESSSERADPALWVTLPGGTAGLEGPKPAGLGDHDVIAAIVKVVLDVTPELPLIWPVNRICERIYRSNCFL